MKEMIEMYASDFTNKIGKVGTGVLLVGAITFGIYAAHEIYSTLTSVKPIDEIGQIRSMPGYPIVTNQQEELYKNTKPIPIPPLEDISKEQEKIEIDKLKKHLETVNQYQGKND